MKYLKILGLAAVAAAALMAFIGASTASAQVATKAVLCNTTPTGGICGAGNILGEGTEISSQLVAGATANLTPSSELPEDVCKKSTANGKTESKTTPTGKQTITFSECSQTTEVIESGTLTVHHDTLHNGNLTATGVRVRVKALFGSLSCDFGGEIKEGLTLTGGNPAKLDATATIPMIQETGFIECPKSAVWHAEYEVTSPKPLFVGTEE